MKKQHRRLNILMITPTPFFADRGCHIRILEEARALVESKHKVKILTYHFGRNIRGIDVDRVSSLFFWYNKLEAGPSWWKPFIDVQLIFKTIKELRSNKYDVIHAHLHEGALVALVARVLSGTRIPILFDYQGSLTGEIIAHQFIQKSSMLYSFFKFIEQQIDERVDCIITSSTAATNQLITQFNINASKVSTFLDQINTTIYKPHKKDAGLMKKFGISKDDFVIGYMGILTEYQGVDLLLESFKKFSENHKDEKVKLLIAGYPNIQRYENLAVKLDIADKTIFAGRVNYEKAGQYVNLFDLAIAPKLVSSESNGKILLYMSVGLPTIAFDTQTNRELLKESGLIVSKISAENLTLAIENLYKNTDERNEFGGKARKAALKNYSWSGFANKLEQLYVLLIKN